MLISIIPWICINSSDLYFMSNRSELSRKRINRDKSRSSVKSDFGTPCILLLHLINPKSVSELMRKEISKLLSAVLRLSFIFCVSGSLIRNKWSCRLVVINFKFVTDNVALWMRICQSVVGFNSPMRTACWGWPFFSSDETHFSERPDSTLETERHFPFHERYQIYSRGPGYRAVSHHPTNRALVP